VDISACFRLPGVYNPFKDQWAVTPSEAGHASPVARILLPVIARNPEQAPPRSQKPQAPSKIAEWDRSAESDLAASRTFHRQNTSPTLPVDRNPRSQDAGSHENVAWRAGAESRHSNQHARTFGKS